MRRLIPLALALTGCATVDLAAAPPWAEPTFTTSSGVLVELPAHLQGYLTPAMAEELEAELADAFGVPRAELLPCLMGVRAVLVDAPRWSCTTRVHGQARAVECVGSTDGRWWIRMARLGRCAYNTGSNGPPYAHELAHVVMRCRGRGVDWNHEDPVWRALQVERPCP